MIRGGLDPGIERSIRTLARVAVILDMGGMGFIENDRCLCLLSGLINTHLLMAAHKAGVKRYFHASSACVYAADKQTDPNITGLRESDVYPAMPEDGYGWEKLFRERMGRHFHRGFRFDHAGATVSQRVWPERHV